jgi:hypothetical protein
MKTQHNPARWLLTLGLSLACLSAFAPRVQADANGNKPYKSEEVMVSRTDGLAPGTWQDPFLVAARLSAPGYYYEDTEFTSEGRDNYGGRFTKENHEILYITSFTPSLMPITGKVFIWSVSTSANGDQRWSAITGDVDFSTGEVSGEWRSFIVNDPESEVTGSGTFTSVVRPDLGDRFYETIATGKAKTRGALKH